MLVSTQARFLYDGLRILLIYQLCKQIQIHA